MSFCEAKRSRGALNQLLIMRCSESAAEYKYTLVLFLSVYGYEAQQG